MPTIKINTFGEGIEIRKLELDSETYYYWNTIAMKKNVLLSDLILDPFFYYDLKDSRFKALSDINFNVISGMLNSSKSFVEIWFNRKKVVKISSQELFSEMLLFPLFSIEKSPCFLTDKLESGIYVVQKTIGLLVSEKLNVLSQQLDIDDFTFSIAEFENNQFLTNIKYQNQNLNFIKSETIITFQSAFEIK